MKKEYIIGGLAIVGGLSLLAYLTSKPRRNSEGFFGATGRENSSGTIRLPMDFTRKPRPMDYCTRYLQMRKPDGSFIYFKKPYTGDMTTPFQTIRQTEFKNAYYNLPQCM